jgi:hypothetical protein
MNATVTVSLANTSPAANGGFITAFVFNIPDGTSVTSATIVSTSGAFDDAGDLLGPLTFNNSVSGVPNGQFDIGLSTGGDFEGGGNPTVGIGVGETETFTFTLIGLGFSGLTAQDFLDALSVGPGIGQGPEDFVVRFRGFEDGGSDKVPNNGDDEDVPEPGTGLLFGLGMAVFLTSRLRRSRN